MVIFLSKEILGFSTTKNSSPEIFEGIFGEEIWEGFLVICGIFFLNGGKDFRIFLYQNFFPRGNWRSIWGWNLGIISLYPWYFLLLIGEEILGFSTTKNSSPEVIEGIFGEEIWDGFLILCGIFFNDRGRDLRIFHHQKFFPRGNWRNI